MSHPGRVSAEPSAGSLGARRAAGRSAAVTGGRAGLGAPRSPGRPSSTWKHLRRAKRADFELFAAPISQRQPSLHTGTLGRAVPAAGPTAGHVAVALADVTALEPAGPARQLGGTGGDPDASSAEGGSRGRGAAAGRGAASGQLPLADLDAAAQAGPCGARPITGGSPAPGGLGALPAAAGLLTEAGGLGGPAAIGLAGAGGVPQQHEAGPAAVAHHGAHPPVVAVHHRVKIRLGPPAVHCTQGCRRGWQLGRLLAAGTAQGSPHKAAWHRASPAIPRVLPLQKDL